MSLFEYIYRMLKTPSKKGNTHLASKSSANGVMFKVLDELRAKGLSKDLVTSYQEVLPKENTEHFKLIDRFCVEYTEKKKDMWDNKDK